MPLIESTHFNLTVHRPNGTGVAGAAMRFLSSVGADITASLYETATPLTDANGKLTGNINASPANNALYAGQTITIQVLANGYEPWTFDTPYIILPIATYVANLIRVAAASDYTIIEPVNAPLSSMAPIVCSVQSPNSYDWEQINATVTHPNNDSSIIQAPVDKSTHRAELDIRNRVKLGIRPLLVPDASVARDDTDFSTAVNVTFVSVTDEGEVALTGQFRRLVAHTLPPDGQTDLSDYTKDVSRSWIVTAQPVIAFRGYYRDVMIWLPVSTNVNSLTGSGATYTLTTTYYNGAGQLVSTATAELTENDYVQRIRLNTNPADGIVKAILMITSDGSAITQPLTVLYRD